jgi:predicted GTPase
VGASQTCKSTTLKLLTGDESVVCGDDKRRASTTYDIRIYREFKSKMSRKFLHIDTMGFGDTRLKYSNTDIRNKI